MDYFTARNAVAVTPHDTAALSPIPTALYVGGAGNIALRAQGSSADVTLIAVPVGTVLYISAQYVRATSTTATNLVALS